MTGKDSTKIVNYFFAASAVVLAGLGLEHFARKSGFIPKLGKKKVKYADPFIVLIPVVNKRIGYECDNCFYFETSSCSIVEGKISPTAGCIRWIGSKIDTNY